MNSFIKRGRRCFAALLAAGLLWAFPSLAQGVEPGVSAECAVLISGETGTVLYEKNAYERHAMASTTKIMTALLALEESARAGDPVVDITEEMVAVEGSSMGLQVGNRLHLSELTAGMMLASGNDAANACALFLSGSQEGFGALMNERAGEIGMKDTHFVTPSGLDDEAHFSTAYDMALLTKTALENQDFEDIVKCFTRQVEFLDPAGSVSYTNHNKLLQLYEGCIGVKTGFTKKAGRCLVSAARREGATLIAVTLNAPDDWDDHIALLDYGFSMMQSVAFDGAQVTARVPLAGGSLDSVQVQGAAGEIRSLPAVDAERIERRVLLPKFLYAPVHAGDKVGQVQYFAGGKEIYSLPVVAAESVPAAEKKEPGFWQRLFHWDWA